MHVVVAAALAAVVPLQAQTRAQSTQPLVAVFAHPDDERIIGPLLSRLAREGRETHLVIATDGAKGVRDFARIPAGPELGRLRSALVAILDSLGPAAIITFGPEGGTGHPDHRLVGNVVTQIVQSDARHLDVDLLYASLPTERLRTAPPARPGVNGTAEALLTVRVPFEERDLAAAREEFACHRSQYTPAEMDAVNRYLEHAWNGTVWLRPWNGVLRDPGLFVP